MTRLVDEHWLKPHYTHAECGAHRVLILSASVIYRVPGDVTILVLYHCHQGHVRPRVNMIEKKKDKKRKHDVSRGIRWREDFSHTMSRGTLSFAHLIKNTKNIPDVFGHFVLSAAKRKHVVAWFLPSPSGNFGYFFIRGSVTKPKQTLEGQGSLKQLALPCCHGASVSWRTSPK